MNYKTFAESEFKVLGWPGEDEMQADVCKCVLDLLEVFSKQGHSGSSAPYVVSVFKDLATFKPISPLTGKDEEWNKVEGDTWQNKRCSHVFKDKDGRAYDIEGKIFIDKDGSAYTNKDSHVYITFPYTPKREYVNEKAEEDK